MFIIIMCVNLCVYSVSCDEYEEIFSEDKSPRKLNSTIKPSVSKYRETKTSEDAADFKSTLIDYPFVASIQRQGSHYATGALVDKRWVLSVAGDFYNVRESIKLFRVRLGSVDCKRGGSVFPIKLIQIHPSYVHGKPGFDLSMIRLALPVVTSCVVKPIVFSKGRVSKSLVTTYWPRIIVNGSSLPASAEERVDFTNMRTSRQTRIPFPKCKKMMEGLQISLKFNLCVKPLVTFHSDCMPDAGAPVIGKDGLVGITSGWVYLGCPSNPGPTLVTRVISSVRSWIEEELDLYY